MQADVETGAVPSPTRHGLRALPLPVQIVIALALGVVVGLLVGPRAAGLEAPSKLILRVLGALAPPLILVAVVDALMKAKIPGRQAGRLAFLLVLNTLVAICIGLLVANVVRPGKFAKLDAPEPAATVSMAAQETDPTRRGILETLDRYGYKPAPEPAKADPLTAFLDDVPKSLAAPLVDNNIIGIILIAIAFGVALRDLRDTPCTTVGDLVGVAMKTLLTILGWVIVVVPLGVFGIVASIVGRKGLAPFASLGMFIVAVLLGLLLQACYYLARVRAGSWVRPWDMVRGCRDALTVAFSTASSTVAMPINFTCLLRNVGLRERSASLGALIGTNFNNDGTALYEAMSALFISQLIGHDLSLGQQIVVVLTSVIASVGAAGIPEAGLVTMTLVFTAVGLPTRYIALLLTVDWFLDRCRTAINIMGDMNISCLLDGKTPPTAEERNLAATPPLTESI